MSFGEINGEKIFCSVLLLLLLLLLHILNITTPTNWSLVINKCHSLWPIVAMSVF